MDLPQWRSCESLRVNVAEEETALNGRKPASQDGKARTHTKPSVTLRRSATLLRERSTPNAGSAFEAMTLFKLALRTYSDVLRANLKWVLKGD